MTIRRVVPNIRAVDLEQNRQFYADFLGFKVSMDLGWILTFGSPENPTAQISVIRESMPGIPHPDMTVEVGDVDEMHARAVALELEIVYPLTDEEWGVRRFFVKDPNGLVLNVVSHSSG
jgi:catechol 2,3-dioxygenase-like lactoylglutathione lyase family enzyme